MLPGEVAVLGLALIDHAALLLLLVYHVFTLSDLECDYLNPVQCCELLNRWLKPRIAAQAVLTLALFFEGSLFLFAFSLPVLLYQVYRYWSVPPGDLSVYDPLKILNGRVFTAHLREVSVCLGYYLVFFFVYLYFLIVALLKGDPIERHHEETILTEL